MVMIYGYARVSTSGQSLKDQVNQLKDKGIRDKNIYREHFTGTTINRSEIDKLLKVIRTGDTLIVTKLDRLARKTTEAITLINKLLEMKVTIKIINLGTVEDTPMGRMIIRTLASVAEMERDMIVDRTAEGKAYARAHNPYFREGRPKSNKHSTVHGISYQVIYLASKRMSVRRTADEFNVAPSTVTKIKKICSE